MNNSSIRVQYINITNCYGTCIMMRKLDNTIPVVVTSEILIAHKESRRAW